MSTTLFAVPKDDGPTTFCGPTAIAAVTGVPVREVERVVLELRKRDAYRLHPYGDTVRKLFKRDRDVVRGMNPIEVPEVMRKLGFRLTAGKPSRARMTFASWAWWSHAQPNKRFLVIVTGHLVACADRKFVDTIHREPIPLWLAWCKRKRVTSFWEVSDALPA